MGGMPVSTSVVLVSSSKPGNPWSQFEIPQKAVVLGLPGPVLEMFSDH